MDIHCWQQNKKNWTLMTNGEQEMFMWHAFTFIPGKDNHKECYDLGILRVSRFSSTTVCLIIVLCNDNYITWPLPLLLQRCLNVWGKKKLLQSLGEAGMWKGKCSVVSAHSCLTKGTRMHKFICGFSWNEIIMNAFDYVYINLLSF